MASADEVDEELVAPVVLDESLVDLCAAQMVDTDDELTGDKAPGTSRPVWCLWGVYEPAQLLSVQQSNYHVAFEDGVERWCAAGELILPQMQVPHHWFQPGAPIFRPVLPLVGKDQLEAMLAGTMSRMLDYFSLIDCNGNGTVSREEFESAIELLGVTVSKQDLDTIFNAYDRDGSGVLTYYEYIRLTLRNSLAKASKRVMDLFRSWDKDGSDSISRAEFRQAAHTIGFDAPDAEIDRCFDEMDSSGDGMISFREMNRQLRSGLDNHVDGNGLVPCKPPQPTYVQGTLVAPKRGMNDGNETWMVRTDDDEKSLTHHPVSALRMPMAHFGMLGHGGRAKISDTMLALRGRWRKGIASCSSHTRGHCVTLEAVSASGDGKAAPGLADVWVTGDQIYEDSPVDPSTVSVPGVRVLGLPSSGSHDDPCEMWVRSAEGEQNVLCAADDGSECYLSLTNLRLRMAPSFRALVASGGFQRATVTRITPDGMYAVSLVGGAMRWASACELVSPLALNQLESGDNTIIPVGTLVAVAPEEGIGKARWITAATVAARSADGNSPPPSSIALRRPALQTPLRIHMVRGQDGSFGFGVDASSCVSDLKTGGPAASAGLEMGDRVLMANGVAVKSNEDLAEAVAGKGEIDVAVAVDCNGAAEDGDGNGDGEVNAGEKGVVWVVPRGRVLVPLLSPGMCPAHTLTIGSVVFAMVGGWREALVELSEGRKYKMDHGMGEKRWAGGGEIAWHDIAPMKYDVMAAKPMLAWDKSNGAFHPAMVTGERTSGFTVVFDSGSSTTLTLADLRERWTLPVRVLCQHGDYMPCKILEALGGLLRVEFADSSVEWALPNDVLAEQATDSSNPLGQGFGADGSHVAVLDNARALLKGDTEGIKTATWRRANLVGELGLNPPAEVQVVMEESQAQLLVPIGGIRRLRRPDEAGDLVEGDAVHALRATWLPGVIYGIADECHGDGFDLRIPVHAYRQTGSTITAVDTTVSSTGFVTMDEGDAALLSRLKRGKPLLVRDEVHGRWREGLLVKLPDKEGMMTLMCANGNQVVATTSQVRARVGESHPIEHVSRLIDNRSLRFEGYMALVIQKKLRMLLARRLVKNMYRERNAAVRIQKHARGWLCRLHLAYEIAARSEKAATRIQTAYRGCVRYRSLPANLA